MKVIIDTNILISAVLRGRNPREVVQLVIDSSDFDWIVSQEVLEEYREVINRPKFKTLNEERNRWLNEIERITTLVEVEVTVDFPRDAKDAKFIALAMASEADFLITGDKDFNEVRELGKTAIVSVSTFKDLFIDEGMRD